MYTIREALAQVAQETGLTPEAVELRKAFLEFTQSDTELLIAVHEHMESLHLDEALTDMFYRHVLSFPQLRRFIPDEAALQRLKTSQARYFRRLTSGDYGEDYVLDRLRVGMAHQQAGMETQWYIGAYRKYLSFFLARLREMPGLDDKKFVASVDALMKIVFLDLGIALDTYFHRAQQQVIFMANHDVLTSLPNRTLLNDRVDQAVRQANRNGEHAAILLIDLDRFKNINDSMGHMVGDKVILAVAERLAGSLGESDTLARLGDDEFVVLLQNCRSSDLSALADTLLRAIAQPIAVDEYELLVSASMGIALYPMDGRDRVELLKNADAAMHRAKQEGGNACCFFQPAMDVRTTSIVNMETRLRRALDNGELSLDYQLQVDVASGRPVGAEALLRWLPGDSQVPPIEFIPLAEETGLIISIGEWVLKTACKQAVEWNRRLDAPFTVAVNISARQLWGADFVETVSRTLAKTGCDPRWLELEITENAIMVRPEEAASTIRALASTGVRISIDDFGTGYSSLSYLKLFPVHAIKIDRSFVRQMNADSADASIVRAVIAMAHSLRMKVVGEGVEDVSQLLLLGRLGCDLAQGYYFSHPLPAERVAALLAGPLLWMHVYERPDPFSRRTPPPEGGSREDIACCRVLRIPGSGAICMVDNPCCSHILPFGSYCEHPLVDYIAEAA